MDLLRGDRVLIRGTVNVVRQDGNVEVRLVSTTDLFDAVVRRTDIIADDGPEWWPPRAGDVYVDQTAEAWTVLGSGELCQVVEEEGSEPDLAMMDKETAWRQRAGMTLVVRDGKLVL